MILHKATKEKRDEQLRAFFAKLPRDALGKLTKAGRQGRDGWLRQECLSHGRAHQILAMAPPKQRAPFNADYAENCASYLRAHGYTVAKPDAQVCQYPATSATLT